MAAAQLPRLEADTPIYVAGHRGLAGSAIWRALERRGCENLVGATSDDVDLRDRDATMAFVGKHRPRVMVMAAARVGGILANSTYPADFLSDNLRIQLNLLDAAAEHDVERVLFLGSSCIYPRLAEQPIREESLLTGPLEPTNDAYAIAKIAGIAHVQAMRRQHGRRWISAMPTNLYGPGDNFDPHSSHVLPALIRRCHEARESAAGHATIWGSGRPRRELLHVDDLADAACFLLEHYDDAAPVNVGTGVDLTIAELAHLVADVVGFRGELVFDPSKPDGTPRKVLDVGRLAGLGWTPSIGLREGIERTYAWFVAHQATARL
jgi:GDP-L-fucose synthase